jgi:hypothetical protein
LTFFGFFGFDDDLTPHCWGHRENFLDEIISRAIVEALQKVPIEVRTAIVQERLNDEELHGVECNDSRWIAGYIRIGKERASITTYGAATHPAIGSKLLEILR